MNITSKDQIRETEFLRREFPDIPQRTFARILDEDRGEGFLESPGPPPKTLARIRQAAIIAGGWGDASLNYNPYVGYHTIYGRVRRIDNKIKAEQAEALSA